MVGPKRDPMSLLITAFIVAVLTTAATATIS